MQVLAHRGYWKIREEKNSLAAIQRAFDHGYGVETDVRDLDGELVISHDPPRRGAITLKQVVEMYNRSKAGPVAINIKADGLAAEIAGHFAGARGSHFAFDMSVPDMFGYITVKVPVFTRYSEYEPQPPAYDSAVGVWLDAFNAPTANSERLRFDLANEKAVALVSPELHGWDYAEIWQIWREIIDQSVGLGSDKIMICTDYPEEADRYFNPSR